MKRYPVSIQEIADWHNVAAAGHRAARGKRDRPDVLAFFQAPEASITAVQEALAAGIMPVGSYQRFIIHDPKRRAIHAAPFADRVAHHALMAPLTTPLDHWQVPTSFACRRNKGTHAAVQYAQRQMRRYRVFLKMDVSGYFDHIDHEHLLALLRCRLKGRALFTLLQAVLDTYAVIPGRGLPIGALTSQHFANVYLTPADRWLLDYPDVKAHVRYMDDTVIWCDTSREARSIFQDYSRWLKSEWHLELKTPVIQKTMHKLAFCGYRIGSFSLQPGRRRIRRFNRLLKHWHKAYSAGCIHEGDLQSRVDSLLAMLQPADTTAWRRQRFANSEWPQC